MVDSPLTETYRRLSALAFHQGRFSTAAPCGDRWLRVDQVLDGGLDVLFADGAAACGDAPDYLTAHVASALAAAVVAATWTPVLRERRLPVLDPSATFLHRAGGEPWFDEISVTGARLHVLADDGAAGRAGVFVARGLAELHAAVVDQLLELLPPLFDAIGRRGRFGRSGMWGQVADLVAGNAIWTAHSARTDQQAAWAEAGELIVLLRSRVPSLRARPRPFPVTAPSMSQLFQVKGTCCLWYKTQPDAHPDRDGYCLTCPRRTDDVRHAQLVTYLQEGAALSPPAS